MKVATTYHVKYREEEKEVVESLVDCLGGEDDEGEDVTNKSKGGNNSQENTTKEETQGWEPGKSWLDLLNKQFKTWCLIVA